MAFKKENFSTIGGQSTAGANPALYCYHDTDAQTTVRVSGFFNDLSDLLSVGDMIYVHGATGGTRTITLHVVVSNASGVVDIGDGTTAAVVTDTD